MRRMPALHARFARRSLHVQPAGRHVAAIGAGCGGDGRRGSGATPSWKSSSCRASRKSRCTKWATRSACAHNFKASTLYSLAELNDAAKTGETGIGASVMDYNPVNIMPEGKTQGDFFSTTIGPYDMWAIEYGYKPLKGGSPDGEVAGAEEDCGAQRREGAGVRVRSRIRRGIDPDPHSVRYDLGNDLVDYAKSQAKLVAESWPNVVDDMTKDGEGYQRARRAFGVLLARHGAGDVLRGPIRRRPVREPQPQGRRECAEAAGSGCRSSGSAKRWRCWKSKCSTTSRSTSRPICTTNWPRRTGITGAREVVERGDYPVHDIILMWQDRIVSRLLSPLTLSRLHDSELKVAADADALTTAELLERLTKAVYSEVDTVKAGEFTNRKPAISSLRRNLQRAYLRRMSQLALGQTVAPEDCQTIAFAELGRLKTRIDTQLAGEAKLDSYSRAHLEETSARITKVVDARMLVSP